jgi:lipopolysaccharide transport protein LptA
VERKNEDDGTVVKGWGDVMEYFAADNKAFLEGHVTINQDSPRLAKPAVITGRRVDMDMKTKENVVVRTPDTQAKVHIEPKGNDPKAGTASAAPKPEPEPVDLVADRIQMNSETQAYVATGHPVMVRPSSRLQAKKIRFTIDPKTNEVSTAYADDDVVFDGKNDKGAVMHSTGDNGTYNQQDNMLHMVGNVHALSKDPTAQSPTLYECDRFEYNTKTGQRSADGHVRVNIPPTAQANDPSKPGSDKTKPEKPKPADKTKPAKPADKPKASDPVGEK